MVHPFFALLLELFIVNGKIKNKYPIYLFHDKIERECMLGDRHSDIWGKGG
jgi:hypothetical protein